MCQETNIPKHRSGTPGPPIRIVVDDRESRKGVTRALQETEDVSVSFRRLPLGDYLVDLKFLVERKTFSDFACSIKDGRLFHQASRLASQPIRSAILLEGTLDDLQQSSMSREAMQGALIALTIVYGIPVLRSTGPQESSRLLLYAARQIRSRQLRPLRRQAKRPKGKTKLQLHILQGLPGIGPARARTMLQVFGSVLAIVNAPIEELTKVRGIGKKSAAAIRWSVSE